MNDKNSNIAPNNITKYLSSVVPAMAMLAGIELDIFVLLKDGPKSAKALANALNVDLTKLFPLLNALVMYDLLIVENELFSNTDEAQLFLVRGSPDYLIANSDYLYRRWNAVLKTGDYSFR